MIGYRGRGDLGQAGKSRLPAVFIDYIFIYAHNTRITTDAGAVVVSPGLATGWFVTSYG